MTHFLESCIVAQAMLDIPPTTDLRVAKSGTLSRETWLN